MKYVLLLLLWGLAGCDEAGEPVLDGGAPVADAALDQPDARAGAPLGGLCPDGLCAAGVCASGRCARPCLDDVDCPEPGLVCAGDRCAPACAAGSECVAGEVCVTAGPGQGACLPSGSGAGGARCETGGDCVSWVCSGGVCLAPCDEVACGPGLVCVPLHTQSVCVTQGALADEALCSRGPECESGLCRGGRCSVACSGGAACPHDRVCRAYETLDLCERPCADSRSCGVNGVCALVAGRRQCVTRGPGGPGAACAAAAACASGVCVDGGCAGPCAVDGRCAAGEVCLVDLAGATCRPAGPEPVGGACGADATCATGLCAAGRCGSGCVAGGCPAGLRCTAFLTGNFCFEGCAQDRDCAEGAFCDPSFSEGPTCFWRGRQVAGGGCDRHGACASGRCAGGVCRAACASGVCPAGQLCRAFSTGAFCSPEPLVEGAACAGAVCAEGLICAAGVCLAACEAGCAAGTRCFEGLCHPRCERDASCRPGRRCERVDASPPVCIDAGPLADGAACARSSACASGLCMDGVCRAACVDGCEAGAACVPFDEVAWCLEAGPGAVGEVCAADAECAFGLCVGLRCAAPCPVSGVCEGATVCRALRAGSMCVHRCDPLDPSACGAGQGCAPLSVVAEGQCVALAGAALGAACEGGCAAPNACVDGRCLAPCVVDEDCEVGTCARAAAGAAFGACRPVGVVPEGGACAAHVDCADGVCDAARGRCGRPCAGDWACRLSARCVDLARDPLAPQGVCATRCEAESGCAVELACRLDGQGQGACW
jgi:hypothetical protein